MPKIDTSKYYTSNYCKIIYESKKKGYVIGKIIKEQSTRNHLVIEVLRDIDKTETHLIEGWIMHITNDSSHSFYIEKLNKKQVFLELI